MNHAWREVPHESVPRANRAEVEELVGTLGNAEKSPRAFQSSTGVVAILLDRNAFTDSHNLSLELERDCNNIAVVLHSNATDVHDLLKYCDVIALPQVDTDTAPKEMVPCGRLTYGETAVFTLFCNEPADANLLARDAPLHIGEPNDNLDSREKWFRKRHDSKQ